MPKKVETRLTDSLKKYKRIVANARKKDINESDTVTVIVDMFTEIFGYDKYSEITSEYAIRSTYCDLAIKIGKKLTLLVECKAIGKTLKEDFVRQAIDYGTKEGIPWVVLTNGDEWRVYKIIFKKQPVVKEEVFSFIITEMQAKDSDGIDKLYALSREGMSKSKSAISDYYDHVSTVNKYMLGQLILEDSTISHIRRMLKKISPEIKVDNDKLAEMVTHEVIKRDVLDPENTVDCRRIIKRKLAVTKPKVAKPTVSPSVDATTDIFINGLRDV
jgi:hypothetical protein